MIKLYFSNILTLVCIINIVKFNYCMKSEDNNLPDNLKLENVRPKAISVTQETQEPEEFCGCVVESDKCYMPCCVKCHDIAHDRKKAKVACSKCCYYACVMFCYCFDVGSD